MQPTLPIEIVEWILDFVLEETTGKRWMWILMECVLVCRAWVPRCQSHLFREVLLICPDVPDRIYQWCRRLEVAPHLRRYVQRFRLYETDPLNGHPLYPIFLSVLAPRLPSLRELDLFWGNLYIRRHRFFCAPPFRSPAITSFQIQSLTMRDWSSIYDMLPLFPNLRTLTFAGITWPTTSEDDSDSMVTVTPLKPRQVLSLPPITRLAVATETAITIDTESLINSHAQLDGLRTLLGVFASTFTSLKINLGTFNYLTHPYLHPDRLCATIWDFPKLESLDVYLRGPRMCVPKEPYAARVARLPKLLWALRAQKLRIITVYFSQFELKGWKTLDHLAVLNQELDELDEMAHFPRLEKIRFDVGSIWIGRTCWNECLAEMFPRLWEKGIMEQQIFAVPVWDVSLFSDHLGSADTAA